VGLESGSPCMDAAAALDNWWPLQKYFLMSYTEYSYCWIYCWMMITGMKTPSQSYWSVWLRLDLKCDCCQAGNVATCYVYTGSTALRPYCCPRQFLAHDILCLARYMLSFVCPSHGCIIEKRLKLGLWNFHHRPIPLVYEA